MNEQGHLFPLPQPVDFRITEPQKAVLDWLALGAFTGLPYWLSRPSLRSLVKKGLVEATPGSPAHYKITGIGSMVRLHAEVQKK